MKHFLFVLFLMGSAIAHGQNYIDLPNNANHTNINRALGPFQVNGTMKLLNYIPTTSATYLTVNSQGYLVLANGGGSGGSTTVQAVSPLQANTVGDVVTISLPQANGIISGYLTAGDWTLFNNKLPKSAFDDSMANYIQNSSNVSNSYQAPSLDLIYSLLSGLLPVALQSGNILIGNSSNLAQARTMSGHGTLSNTGVFTLQTANATPATYGSSTSIPVITVDAYGRATTITTVAPGPYVTSVSINTANGISATNTGTSTAPAFTYSLGDITPRNVAATGAISGSNFSGSSSGTNTGDQTNITGNASTATALQNARTFNGVSFNGTANVLIPALIGSRVFSVTGTQTYTPTAGTRIIKIRMWGGGGGSGGCFGNSTNFAFTSGGGAGCPATKTTTVNPAITYTLTVGTGGIAGSVTGSCSVTYCDGGAGGSTSFTDGVTTITAPGGPGSLKSTFTTTAKTGAMTLGGGPAVNADFPSYGSYGMYAYGNSTNVFVTGAGGSSEYGMGGLSVNVMGTNGAPGNNGLGFGAGASGAASTNSVAQPGGAGAPGLIIIDEYY